MFWIIFFFIQLTPVLCQSQYCPNNPGCHNGVTVTCGGFIDSSSVQHIGYFELNTNADNCYQACVIAAGAELVQASYDGSYCLCTTAVGTIVNTGGTNQAVYTVGGCATNPPPPPSTGSTDPSTFTSFAQFCPSTGMQYSGACFKGVTIYCNSLGIMGGYKTVAMDSIDDCYTYCNPFQPMSQLFAYDGLSCMCYNTYVSIISGTQEYGGQDILGLFSYCRDTFPPAPPNTNPTAPSPGSFADVCTGSQIGGCVGGINVVCNAEVSSQTSAGTSITGQTDINSCYTACSALLPSALFGVYFGGGNCVCYNTPLITIDSTAGNYVLERGCSSASSTTVTDSTTTTTTTTTTTSSSTTSTTSASSVSPVPGPFDILCPSTGTQYSGTCVNGYKILCNTVAATGFGAPVPSTTTNGVPDVDTCFSICSTGLGSNLLNLYYEGETSTCSCYDQQLAVSTLTQAQAGEDIVIYYSACVPTVSTTTTTTTTTTSSSSTSTSTSSSLTPSSNTPYSDLCPTTGQQFDGTCLNGITAHCNSDLLTANSAELDPNRPSVDDCLFNCLDNVLPLVAVYYQADTGNCYCYSQITTVLTSGSGQSAGHIVLTIGNTCPVITTTSSTSTSTSTSTSVSTSNSISKGLTTTTSSTSTLTTSSGSISTTSTSSSLTSSGSQSNTGTGSESSVSTSSTSSSNSNGNSACRRLLGSSSSQSASSSKNGLTSSTSSSLSSPSMSSTPPNDPFDGNTPDGSCGPTSKGNWTCKDNNCCSSFGWCGKTLFHCGRGCQFNYGRCLPHDDEASGGDAAEALGAGIGEAFRGTKDGNCGKAFGVGCGTDKCCSFLGWCGSTSFHCGVGCQVGFGNCD